MNSIMLLYSHSTRAVAAGSLTSPCHVAISILIREYSRRTLNSSVHHPINRISHSFCSIALRPLSCLDTNPIQRQSSSYRPTAQGSDNPSGSTVLRNTTLNPIQQLFFTSPDLSIQPERLKYSVI
jgi:hypothetical protein